MQRLRKEDDVGGSVVDGDLFHVAKTIVHVFDAMPLGLLARELDHLCGRIHCDDAGRRLCEQKREAPVARAKVGDHHGRHQPQQRFGHAFPGFAGDVILSETAGDAVEEAAHLVLAFFNHSSHRGVVVRRFGNFALGANEQVGEHVISIAGREPVKAVFSRSCGLRPGRLA